MFMTEGSSVAAPWAGHVVIINGTKNDWVLEKREQTNNITVWGFPATIRAGSKVSVPVAWQEEGAWIREVVARAGYGIPATGETFEFQAAFPVNGSRRIQMWFSNITSVNHPKGSTYSIGWVDGGRTNFVLSGAMVGNYPYDSTYAPPKYAWMCQNIDRLGGRTLRRLCMPGSHNAGMSSFNAHTIGASKCNTVAQTLTVAGQLAQGARYFDIRPVRTSGKYATGHYTETGSVLGWQGANGESIAAIVNDVNAFLDGDPEFVVLRLSHDLDTDNRPYRPLNQQQYEELLSFLAQNLKYRYVNPGAADLTQLPLGEFIGYDKVTSHSSVVVVVDPGDATVQIPDSYLKSGFYPASAFPVVDDYTSTENVDEMARDQIRLMDENRTSPDSTVLVLSWTLTQSSDSAVACQFTTDTSRDIVGLANKANPEIYDKLWDAITTQRFPNILYTDNVNQTLNLELALAVNFVTATG